jgi:hypothetical protein
MGLLLLLACPLMAVYGIAGMVGLAIGLCRYLVRLVPPAEQLNGTDMLRGEIDYTAIDDDAHLDDVNPVKPCIRCGAQDRNRCGTCRVCIRAAARKRGAAGKVCIKCGIADRYPSGSCRVCQLAAAKERDERDREKINARSLARYHADPIRWMQRQRAANVRRNLGAVGVLSSEG